MTADLTFHADSGSRTFGVIVVRDGRASAHTRHEALHGTFLGHALLWMSERNPRPAEPVEYRLVAASTPAGRR
jgi:hypothetical protein